MFDRRAVVLATTIGILATTCGGGSGASAPAAQSTAQASPAGGAAAPTAKPQRAKVRFAISVAIPDPGQVWAFVPTGAGFFEEENLDIEFIPNQTSTPHRLVGSGQADVGIGGPDTTMNAIIEGVDVRGYATIVTKKIFRIVANPDGPITSYAQLKGKKVGVPALTSGAYPFARFALIENKLDPDKDVAWVPVGTGGPALDALKNNRIEALSTFDTQIAAFKGLGTTVRILPETSNIGNPADMLITSPQMLQNNRDVLVRFTRAVLKGIVFAQANPGKAIDFFIQQYPDSAKAAPRDAHLRTLQARLENMALIPAQQGKWGYIPLDLYAKDMDVYVQTGVVREKRDVTKYFLNDIGELYRTFKPEDVEKLAKQ